MLFNFSAESMVLIGNKGFLEKKKIISLKNTYKKGDLEEYTLL